jgi:hypothetical protein
LLRRGADPNRVCRAGFPPLHKLMFRRINYKTDIVETVKVLMEAGADINAVNAFGGSVVDIVNAKLAQAKKPWLKRKLSPALAVRITRLLLRSARRS